MGRTSTEVKRRYNEKTYKRWAADLRNEDYSRIEALRGEMSRAKFLKTLIDFYCDNRKEEDIQKEENNQKEEDILS